MTEAGGGARTTLKPPPILTNTFFNLGSVKFMKVLKLMNKKVLVLCLVLGLVAGFLLDGGQKFFPFAQADSTVALSVESVSQIIPGSSADLKVYIDPTASPNQPAGVQWDFSFNPSYISSIVWKGDGAATADAGKSASCSSPSAGVFRCLVFGFNSNTITKGILGIITVTLSSNVSVANVPLAFIGMSASDPDGLAVPVSATDGSLSVKLPQSNTPPNVSITAPATNSTVSGANVVLTAQASSNSNTVANVKFYFDSINLFGNSNFSPYSTNWDTTTVSNGSHSIIAVATDSQGLVNTSSPITLIVNNSTISNPPICQRTSSSTANINQPVNFVASGGNGQFSWSAIGGNPSAQTQSSVTTFSTSFQASGNYVVKLTSNGETVSCPGVTIIVETLPTSCSVSPQIVDINNAVLFTASGGDSQQYSWTVSGGAITSYNGKIFSTTFNTPGTYTATVTSGGKSGNCSVQVKQPVVYTLSCTASSPNVDINQTVTFSAAGGNFPYSWTGGGIPASGIGNNFSTSYASAGGKTITVTSADGQIVHCGTVVNPPACQPNKNASIIASSPVKQGSTYFVNISWISTGSNQIKISKTGSATASSVVVPAGNKSGTYQASGLQANSAYIFQMSDIACGKLLNSVTIITPALPENLACTTNYNTVNANEAVIYNASGGIAPYSWTDGGAPASGTGSNFSTSFPSEGSKSVLLTSHDGQTVSCPVVKVVVITPAVSCTASPQSAKVGQIVSFTASGGNGQQYIWTVSGGAVGNYNGKTFKTTFATPGTYIATVGSGDKNGNCSVVVSEQDYPVLTCAASAASIDINQIVTFNAFGGTAPYTWTGGEQPAGGAGNSFNTSYSSAGGKTAIIHSHDGQIAYCNVYVKMDDVPSPIDNQPPQSPVYNVCVNHSCNIEINNSTVTNNTSSFNSFSGNPVPQVNNSIPTNPFPWNIIPPIPPTPFFPPWLQNYMN